MLARAALVVLAIIVLFAAGWWAGSFSIVDSVEGAEERFRSWGAWGVAGSIALIFFVWVLYALGAFIGVLLKLRWELASLYLPVAVLLAVVASGAARVELVPRASPTPGG